MATTRAARVKALADRPERTRALVEPLADFLGRAGYENTVRLGLIAVTPIVGNDRNWKQCAAKFRALFPERAYTFAWNPETLRRYVLNTNNRRDRTLRAYLMLFLVSELDQREDLYASSDIMASSGNMRHLVDITADFIGTEDVKSLYREDGGTNISAAITSVSNALRSSLDGSSLFRVLFGIREDDDVGDSSYYAVYRYSTRLGEIVKTFLAIQTPKASVAKCFSFAHIYPSVARQKRVSRGAVLGFDHCIHFVGGSANQTRQGSGRNEGIKVIAIPTGTSNPLAYWLMSGVFLSNALAWQPIVGRCVLVHLGFKSQLKQEIRDDHLNITVLKNRQDVRADLETLDTKVKFLERLDKSISEVEEFVLDKINNMPAVDRGQTAGLLRSLGVEDGREPAD